MNKYLVAPMYILMIAMAFFTFKYFLGPKKEYVTIMEKIPEVIYMESEPSPPDTVYVPYQKHDKPVTFYSEKTFKQALFGIDVESKVGVIATCPADSISCKITITPDKEKIAKELSKEIRKISRDRFKNGLMIGAGAASLIIIGSIILAS